MFILPLNHCILIDQWINMRFLCKIQEDKKNKNQHNQLINRYIKQIINYKKIIILVQNTPDFRSFKREDTDLIQKKLTNLMSQNPIHACISVRYTNEIQQKSLKELM